MLKKIHLKITMMIMMMILFKQKTMNFIYMIVTALTTTTLVKGTDTKTLEKLI